MYLIYFELINIGIFLTSNKIFTAHQKAINAHYWAVLTRLATSELYEYSLNKEKIL